MITTCTICGRDVASALQFTETIRQQIGADCCLSCAAEKLRRQLVRGDFAPGAEADALNLRESPLLGSGEVRALIAERLGRASFSRAALHHWVCNGWLAPVEGARDRQTSGGLYRREDVEAALARRANGRQKKSE